MTKRILRLLLALATLTGIIGTVPAIAADLPAKSAVATPFTSYPYQTSGFFFGVFTEGGGGPVSGSVSGVSSSSLSELSMGVGGTVGYVWANPSSPVAISLEGDFGWTNINGSTPGFSLSGPAAFEQRVVIFSPIGTLLAYLPGLPNLGTVPPFPVLPAGVTASNLQIGLLAGIRENDISVNFPGLSSGREWRFGPEIGLVAMEQLSNGAAVRAWVKTVFPDKSVCVGPIVGACAGLGQQTLVGVGFYF
jgi:hypothetical protein